MRIFLDENLPPQLTVDLNAAGHDAVSTNGAGLGGRSDAEIRDYAMRQERVLVRLDADFAHLRRYPVAGTPSVTWLKPFAPFTIVVIERQLMSTVAHLRDMDLHGLLVIVDKTRIRSRAGI